MIVYIHPQFMWREGLRMVLAFGEQYGLTAWCRRTRSGRNVLTLEPAPRIGDTHDDKDRKTTA